MLIVRAHRLRALRSAQAAHAVGARAAGPGEGSPETPLAPALARVWSASSNCGRRRPRGRRLKAGAGDGRQAQRCPTRRRRPTDGSRTGISPASAQNHGHRPSSRLPARAAPLLAVRAGVVAVVRQLTHLAITTNARRPSTAGSFRLSREAAGQHWLGRAVRFPSTAKEDPPPPARAGRRFTSTGGVAGSWRVAGQGLTSEGRNAGGSAGAAYACLRENYWPPTAAPATRRGRPRTAGPERSGPPFAYRLAASSCGRGRRHHRDRPGSGEGQPEHVAALDRRGPLERRQTRERDAVRAAVSHRYEGSTPPSVVSASTAGMVPSITWHSATSTNTSSSGSLTCCSWSTRRPRSAAGRATRVRCNVNRIQGRSPRPSLGLIGSGELVLTVVNTKAATPVSKELGAR